MDMMRISLMSEVLGLWPQTFADVQLLELVNIRPKYQVLIVIDVVSDGPE